MLVKLKYWLMLLPTAALGAVIFLFFRERRRAERAEVAEKVSEIERILRDQDEKVRDARKEAEDAADAYRRLRDSNVTSSESLWRSGDDDPL